MTPVIAAGPNSREMVLPNMFALRNSLPAVTTHQSKCARVNRTGRSLSVWAALALWMLAGPPSFADQVKVHTVVLPDADSGKPFILNVAKATIEGVPEDAKSENEMLAAFRRLGDIVYDVDLRIASGRCAVLYRQRVGMLTDKPPSAATEDRDVAEKVKQGDYLLIKRIDGGHAILFLGSVGGNKGAEISWVLNSGGDTPFRQEEIAAILDASSQVLTTALAGVATIRILAGSDPTVFSFSEGKTKSFPRRNSDNRIEADQRKYGALLADLADIAYDVGASGANFTYVLSRRCKVLGRGWLEDFSGRDIAAADGEKKDLLLGKDLVAGTIIAMQDRGGKHGMIRVESAGTNELKFQWVYLPDGSSVFPRIAPLADAVPVVPEVRDANAGAQSRLMRLVYQSAQMSDEDVEAEFQKVITDGADVNTPSDANGSNPLGRAAWIGSKYLVEILVASGAKIEESEALHAAAHSGRADICKFLLAKGADRARRNKEGLTAFEVAKNSPRSNAAVLAMCQPGGDEAKTIHAAALLGELNLLSELIAKGADVMEYDHFTGKTPLAFAAEAGHVEACRILIEAGADTEKGMQIQNIFPMILAVRAGQMDTVLFLCGKASGKQVSEAFYEAFLRKRPDIAEAVLERSKDASALYRCAQEPIDSLLRSGNRGLYSLLASKGVGLPLWAAAGVGDTNAMKKAIDAGVSVEQPGSDFWGARGETPLLAAAMNGQYEAIRMLLSAGADPNLVLPRSGSSYTPLFNAVDTGDERLVDLLLKSKADASPTNHLGCTPLYLAVRKGHVSIVRALLESGADPNNIPALRSEEGKKASLLEKTQNKDILRMLRSHGAR